MTALCPMRTSSPISIPPWSWKRQPLLRKTRSPNLVFLPQSVVNGGNTVREPGTRRLVIALMSPRTSSGEW